MTDMADTGDITWGRSADERHGRICSDYIEVRKAHLDLPKYRDSVRAAQCMIYARTEEKIFGLYSARALILVRNSSCGL